MSDQTAICATWIKAGVLSMAHMRQAATEPRADTPAMRWGRLCHRALLEPGKVADLPVWSGGRRAGAAWQAFEASVGDGDYIMPEEYGRLLAMRDRTARVMDTLPPVERTEAYIRWAGGRYGDACARVDAILHGGAMLEYKTCAHIDRRTFLVKSEQLGYRLQLGWYAHGLAAATGRPVGNVWVLAQESKPPYCCALYQVPPGVLTDGYEAAAEIAARYRACEACGVFAGPYDGQVLQFERPAWTMPSEVDITGAEE